MSQFENVFFAIPDLSVQNENPFLQGKKSAAAHNGPSFTGIWEHSLMWLIKSANSSVGMKSLQGGCVFMCIVMCYVLVLCHWSSGFHILVRKSDIT